MSASPTASTRTWALVIAAAVLYIPANVYPVLTVIQLGAGEPSTILGGVEELLASQLYPLALAGVLRQHPGAAVQAAGAGRHADGHAAGGTGGERARVLLRERTQLYHVVAWIGRWSMVDIFMESLLGALVQFGRAVTIEPGIGAVAFCAVVFITILAAEVLRSAPDVGCRRPQRPPAAAVRPRLSWSRRGRAG